jgi:hypothetical protein
VGRIRMNEEIRKRGRTDEESNGSGTTWGKQQ